MKQNKTSKRAVLTSALSLLLCCTMLIGTTWAWFTDSVTSAGNIIKSGTLNIDLGIKTKGDTDYVSVKENPTKKAFNYDKWEPGYTEWANAKVYTTGNLALKYTMKIVANGVASKLAEVIDVYYVASEVEKPDNRDLSGLQKLGTLDQAISGAIVINDTLIPGTNEADFATLALHMQETAGNEYQNLSIGTDFSIQILATQFTHEEDTFDDQYDVNATFDVSDVQGFTNALSNASDGDTISIVGNMKLDSPMTINKDITIDGNGNAVIMEKPLHIGANNKVTFKDVAFSTVKSNSSNASFVYASNFAGEFNVIGCTFTDTQWDSIQMTPVDGAVINIENCTFNTTDNLENVHNGKSERYIHIQAAADANVTVSIQGNTFNNIDKVRNSVIDIDYINKDSKVTVGKNTFSGKEVNSSNLGDVIYVCVGSSSAQVATMDTYNAFVAATASDLTL